MESEAPLVIDDESDAVSTVVMWIFTIMLFAGIIVLIYPIISATVFKRDITTGIWAIGTKTSVTLYKTSAIAGALMILLGVIGATLTGISTEKGRETFVRMYMN